MNDMTNTAKAEHVASAIGFFYYEKETGTVNEKIDKTTTSVKMLEITNVEYDDGVATIYLKRPGLIIGRKGENIDKLLKFIRESVKHDNFEVKKLSIKEVNDVRGLFNFYCMDCGQDDLTDAEFWQEDYRVLEN